MSEENKDNMAENDSKSRVYELGYLLIPTIEEGDTASVHEDLKNLITSSFKGTLISDEMPKSINLAYTMLKVTNNVRSKYDTGYFAWIKFTTDPESLLELKKKLDLDPNIIRFLLIKTIKENTFSSKRFPQRDGLKRVINVQKTEENAAPINKEEVDKEIDALISS